jgi:hypothetical protein
MVRANGEPPSRATDSGADEGVSDVPGELSAAAATDAPPGRDRRESVLRRMAEEVESSGLEY